jgi:hypothetical protein
MSGLAFRVESWKANDLRCFVRPVATRCSGKRPQSFRLRASAGRVDEPGPVGLCVSSATARTWIVDARSRRLDSWTPDPRRGSSISSPSSRSIEHGWTVSKRHARSPARRPSSGSERTPTSVVTHRLPRVTRSMRLRQGCELAMSARRSNTRRWPKPSTPPNCNCRKRGSRSSSRGSQGTAPREGP